MMMGVEVFTSHQDSTEATEGQKRAEQFGHLQGAGPCLTSRFWTSGFQKARQYMSGFFSV